MISFSKGSLHRFRLEALSFHRWLGRILVIYLVFVFLTGSLLVFGDKIEAWFSPQMTRQSEPANAPPASLGAVFDAAVAAYPDATPLILRPAHGNLAAAVEMRNGSDARIAWVDPVTAQLQGETPVMGFRETVRLMHTMLMFDSKFTLLMVTSVSFFLAAQIVAGLVSQRRIWRAAFRAPLRQGPGRGAFGGLHRWAGLWALPVLTVIALTGMFYFVEALGFQPDLPPADKVAAREQALPPDFDGDVLDAAIAVAQENLPGLQIREIYLPANSRDAIRVRGDLTAWLVRPRANAVTIDPADLKVLGSFRGEDLSFARRMTEAADPLHFGTFGGVASKVVWLVSGCLAILLAVSGLMVAAYTAGVPGQRSLKAALRAIFLPARVATVLVLSGVGFLLVARLV